MHAALELAPSTPEEEEEALTAFLTMSAWDVEAAAVGARGRHAAGTTWWSLANLMRREGFKAVRDLGVPAAISWANHLGILNGKVPTA